MLLKTKLLLAYVSIAAVSLWSCAQKMDNKPAAETRLLRIPVSASDSQLLSVDRSPMDMIYYPDDYPQKKMLTPDMESPVARVIYSRPQMNGRTVFADSVVTENVIQYYGKPWRLGANEASEIEFFKPVTINGKKVTAGRYIMYCIPYPDKWVIVINQNLFSWGLHIDKSKDIAGVEIPVIKNNVQIEYFTMLFQPSTYGCNLVMAWGGVKAVLPINFN